MPKRLKSWTRQEMLHNPEARNDEIQSTLPYLPRPCAAYTCDCPQTSRSSRGRCATRRVGRRGMARGEVHPGHQLCWCVGLPSQP